MSDSEKAITVISPQTTLPDFKKDVNGMVKLVRDAMKQDQDFGIIPGTKKKTLYDPGAEKLAKFFGLVPDYEMMKEVEDFGKGFFYYKYKCTLTHFNTGKIAGAAERSCNSFEKKYLYGFGNRRNTVEQLIEKINTYQAMAQKRAFVEAVKTATMASEIFTTDISEDDSIPEKPAKLETDPERVILLMRLFVIAGERGFTDEMVKNNLYRKHNVNSLSKVSSKDITAAIENLETRYDIVSPGEKPRLISTGKVLKFEPVEHKTVLEPDPAVTEKDGKVEVEAVAVILPEDTKIEPVADFKAEEKKETKPVKKVCKCGCNEEIEPGTEYNEYFLSKEHNAKWVAKNYPSKVKKLNPDELMARLHAKSAAAPDTDKAAHTA